MPHLCNEPHLWWIVGVVVWEFKLSFEVPTLHKVNDLHEDFCVQFSDCLPHTKYQLAPQKLRSKRRCRYRSRDRLKLQGRRTIRQSIYLKVERMRMRTFELLRKYSLSKVVVYHIFKIIEF